MSYPWVHSKKDKKHAIVIHINSSPKGKTNHSPLPQPEKNNQNKRKKESQNQKHLEGLESLDS